MATRRVSVELVVAHNAMEQRSYSNCGGIKHGASTIARGDHWGWISPPGALIKGIKDYENARNLTCLKLKKLKNIFSVEAGFSFLTLVIMILEFLSEPRFRSRSCFDRFATISVVVHDSCSRVWPLFKCRRNMVFNTFNVSTA